MMRHILNRSARPEAPRRSGWPDTGPGRARLVLLMLMVVVGVVAAAVAWRQETRTEQAREAQTADRIGAAARATAENVVTGLSGAAGLVGADGDVDPEAFEAFRHDLAKSSTLQRLAYVPVVDHDERDAFEISAGVPIRVFEGSFGPSADRDDYWPVSRISPVEALTSPLLGVDIAQFPLVAPAARDAVRTGETQITESIGIDVELLDTASDFRAPLPEVPASAGQIEVFFIVKPLYLPGVEAADRADVQARGEAHVGFVVSVYDGESLAAGIRPELPDGVRYEVRDGERSLTATAARPENGTTRSFDVGGRTWSVQVEDARTNRRPLTLLIVGITLLIVGGLGYLIRRSDRFERDSARVGALIGRTSALAQHLASAATVGDVAAVIARQVPSVFGAHAASLALVGEGGEVEIHHPGALTDSQVSPRSVQQSVVDAGPLGEAVRLGELVLRSSHEDWWGYASGTGVHPEVAAGTLAAAGLPLEGADGSVVGAIAILWDRPVTFDEVTVDTLRTVTELCEQSLHRADLTDGMALRAARLAELAEGLAGATTLEDVSAVAVSAARAPIAADAASIGVIDRDPTVLQVHHGAATAQRPDIDDEVPITSNRSLSEAARTGVPVLIPDAATYRARFPGADPLDLRAGDGVCAALPLRVDDAIVGAIRFAWEEERSFDDAFVSTLSTIAEMVAQSVQRARLAEHQVEDARHSRDLAEFAQGLSSRALTEDVTGFLATGVLAPLDAAHAAVGLVHDGVLHRHFSEEVPADRADVLAEMVETPLDRSTPLTDAMRSGAPVYLADVEELAAAYPGLVEAWNVFGLAATANLPLRDRTGLVIGALGIGWDHPITFTKQLRDRLTTIGGIAAQSLERAQLADLLRVIATRNEQLAELAQRVAQARTLDDLRRVVESHAGIPMDADIVHLALMDDHGALPGVDDPQSVDRPHPAIESLRTQAPVVGEDSAYLPLTAPDGTPLGAIGFGWARRVQVTPDLLATMRTIAELCMQTIERVRLAEAEHRVVASLQNRVVVPLAPGNGLHIAQRYLPATHHVGMGGDWFDGISFPDGRYALVLGDIAGHGITAVADMVQLRAMIEALVRSGTALGEVFARASAAVRDGGDGVTASALLAVVDPAAATLSYVAAGHPPPMLRTASGDPIVLDAGRQPLLGIPLQPVDPPVVPFPTGSMLVAYTDGLIERRDEAIDASIAGLRDVVGGVAGDDVESVADQLLERCLAGREPEDDVALVVLRGAPD